MYQPLATIFCFVFFCFVFLSPPFQLGLRRSSFPSWSSKVRLSVYFRTPPIPIYVYHPLFQSVLFWYIPSGNFPSYCNHAMVIMFDYYISLAPLQTSHACSILLSSPNHFLTYSLETTFLKQIHNFQLAKPVFSFHITFVVDISTFTYQDTQYLMHSPLCLS